MVLVLNSFFKKLQLKMWVYKRKTALITAPQRATLILACEMGQNDLRFFKGFLLECPTPIINSFCFYRFLIMLLSENKTIVFLYLIVVVVVV